MEELLKEIITKLDSIDAHIVTLDTKADKIAISQVRMESQLTEKLRGLYDAREESMDYFANIKDSLARLENKQESF